MSFKSNKQRAFYFAKKSGKPPANPITKVATPATKLETIPQFKIPGLPKKNRFGRIKKNFKMGF